MTAERPVILAVDCSTTACKAVAFDLHGSAVAESRRSLRTTSPQPGWYEQDAASWWEATTDALAAVADLLQPHDRPVAIGMTHQRESFVCVDRRWQPVRPAILWHDRRARRQAEKLASVDVHVRTGKPASTVPSVYKIAWLAEHERDTLRRTHRILDVHAYLAQRLTGHAVSSWASADSTGLLDLATKAWDDALVAACGAARSQLPELTAPGQVIGTVLPDVARRIGLPRGTPVVAGAGDGQCAGIGVGALTPGRAYLNLGTSLSLGMFVSGRPTYPGLRTMAGPDADTCAVETLQLSGAATLTWLQEAVLAIPDPELERRAATVPAGTHGLLFLPYLSGRLTPEWQPDERASLLGLGHQHGPPEIYRAVLEGLAHDQRDCLAHLEQQLDTLARQVVVTGGLGQSPLALQILAAVLPTPLAVAAERESTALGAAVIAATAIENPPYASLSAASAAMTSVGAVITSDPDAVATYRSAARRRQAIAMALQQT